MFVTRKIRSVGKLSITACSSLNSLLHELHFEQRCWNHKHWKPEFKKERAAKVIKIDLPDFDEQRRDMKLSIEELRARMKEKGIVPHREWNEKPMHVSCTSAVVDEYIPPEGDGKVSKLSTSGVRGVADHVGKKGKSYLALRKIRNLDYEFDVPKVAEKVNNVYIEAHECLAKKDEDRLHDLVTEKAYPEMMENVHKKTIRWKHIQTLEPPRVVQIRTTTMMSKDNLFAQITVRIHSRQTLAVYDRFGRLMFGSEDTVKDVLEYVVFEKQMGLKHGEWRIHAKIIPDWAEPKGSIYKTFYLPDVEKEFPAPSETKQISNEAQEPPPQLAAQ